MCRLVPSCVRAASSEYAEVEYRNASLSFIVLRIDSLRGMVPYQNCHCQCHFLNVLRVRDDADAG